MPDGAGLGLAWKIAKDAVPNEGGESKDPRDSQDPRATMDTKAVAQRNAEVIEQFDKKGR